MYYFRFHLPTFTSLITLGLTKHLEKFLKPQYRNLQVTNILHHNIRVFPCVSICLCFHIPTVKSKLVWILTNFSLRTTNLQGNCYTSIHMASSDYMYQDMEGTSYSMYSKSFPVNVNKSTHKPVTWLQYLDVASLVILAVSNSSQEHFGGPHCMRYRGKSTEKHTNNQKGQRVQVCILM